MVKLRSEVHAFFLCILRENSHKLIVNLKLGIQNFYTVMYWIFISENMKVFVLLIMYVIELLISILTDFVASHKIVFYSKLYDIYFLANFTHDRTYITLYVHEILLSLHQHCFLDNKAPRTTLMCQRFHNLFPALWKRCCNHMLTGYYNIYSTCSKTFTLSGTIIKAQCS